MLKAIEDMTPEQRAELEARARFQQVMNTPMVVPTQWAFDSVELSNGQPGVVVSIQQPNAVVRVVLTREEARAFASQLRKRAEDGPGIVAAPAGLVVPRA
jgi:hypothetical protein